MPGEVSLTQPGLLQGPHSQPPSRFPPLIAQRLHQKGFPWVFVGRRVALGACGSQPSILAAPIHASFRVHHKV